MLLQYSTSAQKLPRNFFLTALNQEKVSFYWEKKKKGGAEE